MPREPPVIIATLLVRDQDASGKGGISVDIAGDMWLMSLEVKYSSLGLIYVELVVGMF